MKECIKKNKMLLIITVIFSVMSSVSMVGLSKFIQRIIDYAASGDLDNFKRIIVYSIGYAILMGILYLTYDILSRMFLRNVIKMLRSKIFSGIFRSNYKDFTSVNTADYISVLTNDMKLVEENYILPLLGVLQYGIMFVATVIFLLNLSPFVTLALLVSMLLMFIVPSFFGKALEEKQLNLSNGLANFTSKIKDMFSGYDVVRSFNLFNKINKEFQVENNEVVNLKFSADKLFAVNETLSQLLGMGTQFVAIFLSAYLVINGNLTFGMLMAIVQLSGTLVQPVIMIMTNIPKITSMKPVIKIMDSYINYENKGLIGNKKPEFNKGINVSNLSFKYDDDNEIIKGIDLKINKNKKYAIVGESGCGKSTLIKLMLGYYAGFDGEVYYDGENIRDLDIEKLNRMISTIHQNVYMFDKSIKDNICLQNDFSMPEINKALKLSGADKFINTTQDGLDYLVGENGCNLSGGQRQRIAIARALIQKTPILVLDEGTSAIDMQTAYDIESKLLNINDLTLITITHKMSKELFDLYDEIIFMQAGKVVEKGNFNELIENKKEFYKFYTL